MKLTHPKSGKKTTAANEDRADLLKSQGWVEDVPKPAAKKAAEPKK